jgi:hypothetical protein
MNMRHRVRAAERTADRHRAPEPQISVSDGIDELTAAYLTHPPTFASAIEAGIRATVERQLGFVEPLCDAPGEDRS